jgi:hypothetical protein
MSVAQTTLPRPPRRRSRHAWIAVALVLLTFIGFGIGDYLVGRYQERQIERTKEKRKQLEKMAWYYLRADVDNVKYTSDNRYRVSVWMENAFPEHDIYLMLPTIRTYVQVGPQWKEVPSAEPAGAQWSEGTVVKLEGKITAERIADIQEKDYFELLPGYMHVRFENVMYIAAEPEPKDDVFERSDVYYIHLRPIGADDATLRRLNNFPGAVPMYIGMPPH